MLVNPLALSLDGRRKVQLVSVVLLVSYLPGQVILTKAGDVLVVFG